MGRRLRMSAEIGDWLTDLRTADPAAAAEVAAAIVALLDAPDLPGPSLVTNPAEDRQPTPARQAAALAAAEQSLQWALRLARMAAAEAAGDVRRAATDVRELDRQPHHDQAELAALRRRLAGARLFEQKAAEHSRRSEREVDSFRLRARAATARQEAAVAVRDLRATSAAVQDAGDARRDAGDEGQDDRAAAAEGIARAATYRIRVLLAEAPRLVGRILDGTGSMAGSAGEPDPPATATAASSGQPGTQAVAPGLLELRADPLGGDIRVLFAIEPAGTVTILAVLEGEGAVRVHRDAALALAGDLLAEIRAGEWPPGQADTPGDVELALANSAAFLDRFFAGRPGAVGQRAAARAGAATISGLRRRRGISLADLAAATGISEERLWVIEDDGLRVAQVREAVACVRALGGQLDLTADLDDSGRVILY